MRTFLACCGVNGCAEAINRLGELVAQRRPDAILFAGGLFGLPFARDSPAEAAARRHQDTRLLEEFFATVGQWKPIAVVIPGPHDTPLRAFLMAGMHARSHSPGVHLVHCTIITARDIAISGVGGELTQGEDCGEPVLRCSRTSAEYFLQAFDTANESEKILLLGTAPQGELGGTTGNSVAGDLINSYHPKLCVVNGPEDTRGVQRVAKTTIVNPGQLSEGSAAWIDWKRDMEQQVELI